MRRSIVCPFALAIPTVATPALGGDCPGAATSEEFTCFANSGAADLVARIEWPDERWSVQAHPATRKLRLHVGPGEAKACRSPATEAARPVAETCGDRARRAMKGCDGSS